MPGNADGSDAEISDVEGDWFRARWHFSFDTYVDPEYMAFGTLRVFNDDRLIPGAIWPMHPHRDIEGILHRATLRDPAALIALYGAERDGLEQQLVERALALAGCPAEERAAFARSAFSGADAAEKRWLEKVAGEKPVGRLDPLYRMAWEKLNRAAGLPR